MGTVPAVSTAEFEAAGLYDPEADDAPDRLALLELLVSRGSTIADLVDAFATGDFNPLFREHLVIGGGDRLTPRELAAKIGIEPALVARVWRAAGFAEVPADTPFFSEAVEPAFAGFLVGAALFGDDSTLQFTRVLGSSLARIADAAVSLFLVHRQVPLTEAGVSEDALTRAGAEATLALVEHVPAVAAALFRYHVDAAIRRSLLVRSENVELARLAVGFVDLVGYTDLARQMTARELATAVADFERSASDLVAEPDGRIVKLIGDEVMFVAVDALTACEIARDLCDRVDRHPVLGAARGSVAEGELLTRDGDYYGDDVNLAARAITLAPPGEVVATASVRDRARAAGSPLRFTAMGERRLRGFDAPVELFVVERP